MDDERRVSAASSPSVGDSSFRRTVNDLRLPDVARRGRLFAKRHRRRLVLQSGVCNVSFANVDRRGARLLMDIFTTLLEMKWRYGAGEFRKRQIARLRFTSHSTPRSEIRRQCR